MNDGFSYGPESPKCGAWTPCSEKLPLQGNNVLISTTTHVTIAYRGTPPLGMSVTWREKYTGDIIKDHVMAWMPLPMVYGR